MKIKSEKGSITLLVLTSCLFFIVAVTTVGMHMQAKQIAVDREYKQIKESYEKDVPNIEAIYDELKQIETMPVRFSIPEINESEKNIKISFSLHNPNANINTIKYGWISSEEEIEPNSSNITDWVYLEDKNSENTVIAKSNYTDDKDYYYLCVMINNKEFWPKAPIKVSADASYYGDQIDYDIDLGNNADGEPLNIVGTADYDWEIFYNDGTNIFIIAEDYVPLENPLMPTGLNNTITDIDSRPYCLYWNTASRLTKVGGIDIFGSKATKSTKYLSNKYLIDWKNQTETSENYNAKVVAALMDTSAWSDFANSTIIKNKTSQIDELSSIGCSTIEMWVKSWNQKHGNNSSDENKCELYYASTDIGYYIGPSENPTNASVSVSNKDKLYFPRNSRYGDCSGYWLASPSAGNNSVVIYVYCLGGLYGGSYYYYNFAVRPIVCLPSDITAEWDENNNVWKIIKKII